MIRAEWVSGKAAAAELSVSVSTVRTTVHRALTAGSDPDSLRRYVPRTKGAGRPLAEYHLPTLRRLRSGKQKRLPNTVATTSRGSGGAATKTPDPGPPPPDALRSPTEIEQDLARGVPVTDAERQLIQDLYLVRRARTEAGSAAKRRLEADRASNRLVDVVEVRQYLDQLAAIIRRAGGALERQYDADARMIVDDALDEFSRIVERIPVASAP